MFREQAYKRPISQLGHKQAVTFYKNLRLPFAGSLFFTQLRYKCHSGQSSQLLFDHNHRRAHFLPAVARSFLNLRVTPSREH